MGEKRGGPSKKHPPPPPHPHTDNQLIAAAASIGNCYTDQLLTEYSSILAHGSGISYGTMYSNVRLITGVIMPQNIFGLKIGGEDPK